jgi:4Fe-4S ferredoxin
MAFSVHVNTDRCSGCGNCVVACPVDAIELFTLDPVTSEKIYQVQDGMAVHIDVKSELCAGCGICVEACPMDVIKIAVHEEMRPPVPTRT